MPSETFFVYISNSVVHVLKRRKRIYATLKDIG